MLVTIWDPNAEAVAVIGGVTCRHLTAASHPKLVRQAWIDAGVQPDTMQNPPPDLVGMKILREITASFTPSAARKQKGALGTTPTVDLQAGTATYSYAEQDMAVAARRATLITAIKARVAALVSAGFVYAVPGGDGDHAYQIDDAAQANMTSIGGTFALGVTDAHGGFWRDAANVNVTMTQAECEAFFAAAAAYKAAAVRQMWVLIGAVQDAADHASLDLIDIAAGSVDSVGSWPANGS